MNMFKMSFATCFIVSYCVHFPMAAVRGDLESKCSLPMEVGLCSSRQARWHFNLTSSRCEPFNYTGCRGNDNRFETRSACIAECDPDRCEPVTCRMFCPFGWATDGEGCEICQCRNPCKVTFFYNFFFFTKRYSKVS